MHRVISAIGLVFAAFCVAYFGVAFEEHPPTTPQDFAAWAQTVGSVGAILAAVWVFYRQQAQIISDERSRENEEVRRLLISLHDEIKLTVDSFGAEAGKHIKEGKPATPHGWRVPVLDQPFPIYDAYRDRIGKVQDDELRQLIITGYGLALNLVQSLRFNNHLLDRYEHAQYLAAVAKDDFHRAFAHEAYQRLCAYGDSIRKTYDEAEAAVAKLVVALDRAVVRR